MAWSRASTDWSWSRERLRDGLVVDPSHQCARGTAIAVELSSENGADVGRDLCSAHCGGDALATGRRTHLKPYEAPPNLT